MPEVIAALATVFASEAMPVAAADLVAGFGTAGAGAGALSAGAGGIAGAAAAGGAGGALGSLGEKLLTGAATSAGSAIIGSMIGGATSKPSGSAPGAPAPLPAPVTTMPTPADNSVGDSKQRSIMAQYQRAGRASTILTGGNAADTMG